MSGDMSKKPTSIFYFCHIGGRKQVEIYSLQGKTQRPFRLDHISFLHVKVEKYDVLEILQDIPKRRSLIVDEGHEVIIEGVTEKNYYSKLDNDQN